MHGRLKKREEATIPRSDDQIAIIGEGIEEKVLQIRAEVESIQHGQGGEVIRHAENLLYGKKIIKYIEIESQQRS